MSRAVGENSACAGVIVHIEFHNTSIYIYTDPFRTRINSFQDRHRASIAYTETGHVPTLIAEPKKKKALKHTISSGFPTLFDPKARARKRKKKKNSKIDPEVGFGAVRKDRRLVGPALLSRWRFRCRDNQRRDRGKTGERKYSRRDAVHPDVHSPPQSSAAVRVKPMTA